ncbi:MAG TPA: MarR family winged helix-turn-helix transcriptional regulator [Candidatus Limnocylindria bacterium]
MIAWLEGIVFGGIALTTEALEHATGGRELSFAQWRAILQVGNGEDGCRVGEVASFLHAALPGTSRLLRRLERRGLLTLERDEQDRRATRARLTPLGAQLRSSVLGYRRDEIAAIVDSVRPAATADRTLRDLAAQFDARGQIPRRLNRGASDSEGT